MSELKDSWIKTAKSMLIAANDLGSSLFVSAKAGYNAAMEWAKDGNEDCVQADGAEVPDAEVPEAEVPEAEEAAADAE